MKKINLKDLDIKVKVVETDEIPWLPEGVKKMFNWAILVESKIFSMLFGVYQGYDKANTIKKFLETLPRKKLIELL